MTAPNWFGWIDNGAELRTQKRLAREWAHEVGNDISDYDAVVLAMALDACQTDPDHRNKAEDIAEQERQAAEIAADADWLGAIAYGDADLGTRFTISGGEVMELNAHRLCQHANKIRVFGGAWKCADCGAWMDEANGGDDLLF